MSWHILRGVPTVKRESGSNEDEPAGAMLACGHRAR